MAAVTSLPSRSAAGSIVDDPAGTEVDVCVIGAGVAGLVVAAEAARAGLRVTVLERESATGGILRPLTIEGIEVDAGAESFALRTDAVARLAADLDLPLELVAPEPGGAHLVFCGSDGATHRAPLPVRTILGMPADPLAADVRAIVGDEGARRAALERTLPAEDGPEPSLDALARERYGDAVADLLVGAVCRSVYSRPAAEVRLSSVHPGMWRAYRELGSLTAAAASLAPEARPGSAVGGIRGGVWRLAAALRADAEAHGATFATSADVTALADVRARHVVVATGAAAARDLLGLAPTAATEVALCVVGLRSAAWDARPLGSGAIVAPGVPARAKALTHVDAKWGWVRRELASAAHVVRLSSATADDAWMTDPALVARELELLSGIPLGPDELTDVHVVRWRDALAPDADERALLAARAQERGVAIVGTAVAGTGLASVIPHARAVAATLAARLTPVSTRKEAAR
ncbi:FAD-dependent oxidoreductase [Microbacterium sp. X-17]|uniref:protoporphyrinogen/coproporphyrinogen oxidase n=1 Tax=Microbacterium sp. X-17 TaxID=3144404 RepID=UPI0031F4D373